MPFLVIHMFFLSFNHLDVGEIAKVFVLQTKIIRNFRAHKKTIV